MTPDTLYNTNCLLRKNIEEILVLTRVPPTSEINEAKSENGANLCSPTNGPIIILRQISFYMRLGGTRVIETFNVVKISFVNILVQAGSVKRYVTRTYSIGKA